MSINPSGDGDPNSLITYWNILTPSSSHLPRPPHLLRPTKMASTRGQWASPDRTVVWTEPPPKTTSRAPPPHTRTSTTTTKVPVVYYLSRNGQLDHPHFTEVTLSDPSRGLTLRDVLLRLTALRGDGMPAAYSWSSKRSYRNGYVWHDLTADDVVLPAHGNEYVLKGSERFTLDGPPRPRDASATSSSSSSSGGCLQQDGTKFATGSRGRVGRAAGRGRKNWSSFDLGEYRVAVREVDADDLCAADAATQTDDHHRRAARRRVPELPTETELGIDEISPPPSSSSPDTLETLIKNDARVAALAVAATTVIAPQPHEVAGNGIRVAAGEQEVGVIAGGRLRASAVLMQLISCGSVTVKQDGTAPPPRRRFPRGRSDLSCAGADDGLSTTGSSNSSNIHMEREYFSGSLVETTKKTTTASGTSGVGNGGGHAELKRSSSYNADRCSSGSRGVVVTSRQEKETEEEGEIRPRCIPRKYSKPPSPINHQD